MALLPADAIARLQGNDPSFVKCDLSNNSIYTSKPDEFTLQIAEALKSNTNLKELVLANTGITTAGGIALADAFRVNQTVVKLDLEKNNIESAGIQAIGEMLQFNHSIEEMNLLNQSCGVPGEAALTAFINSFEYNISLLNIVWRLTSRQSFKINSCITRNNEIARRKKLGKSVDDVDPNIRRETAARLLAEREANPVAFVPPVKEEITVKTPVREGGYTAAELAVSAELLPDDVDPNARELHLADAEFKKVMKMDKDEFSRSPAWKRQQKKKEAGLF